MALAYLPLDKILPTFESLRAESGPEFEKLFDYYRSFWIEKLGREIFSVFGQKIRTNNNLEGTQGSTN